VVDRRAAERHLVAVGVAVERPAYPVGVCLALVGLEPTRGDRGDALVEIAEIVESVEEDRHHRVAGAVGVLHDVDRSILGKRPHRLGGVGEEGRLAQQPLVPRPGRSEVPHAYAREEVQRH
jgi:hypothetical protein